MEILLSPNMAASQTNQMSEAKERRSGGGRRGQFIWNQMEDVSLEFGRLIDSFLFFFLRHSVTAVNFKVRPCVFNTFAQREICENEKWVPLPNIQCNGVFGVSARILLKCPSYSSFILD